MSSLSEWTLSNKWLMFCFVLLKISSFYKIASQKLLKTFYAVKKTP